MPEYAILAQDLSRNFGAEQAIDNLTFSVAYGRVAALVGPNGSGKSTLMRLLLGLLRPTRGSVAVLGLEPFGQSGLLRAQIGALLEHRNNPANLSVLESLQCAGEAAPAHVASHVPLQTASARASRIDHLLYRFDLWPYRHHRVVDLSRSARDKLAVVATLVPQPFLLLLDEPFAALDVDHRLHSLAILRQIVRADQATLVFSSSWLEDAQAIADDIIILSNGHITAQGDPAALLQEPSLPMLEITGRGFTDEVMALLERRNEVGAVYRQPQRLVIQLSRQADTAPLISLLVESGADIDEVHKRRWDLPMRYRQLLNPESPQKAA